MALNNDGKFYKDGQIAEVAGKDLMYADNRFMS